MSVQDGASTMLPAIVPPLRVAGEDDVTYAMRKVRWWRDVFASAAHERGARGREELAAALYFGGIIPPTKERGKRSVVETMPNAIADDTGAISRPFRAVDTLELLRRRGTIVKEWHAAGARFRDDFRVAQLDPLRAADAGRLPGNGRPGETSRTVAEARERVGGALDALGGQATPSGSALWFVAGCELSIKEWARRCQWGGGRSLSERTALGVLLAALGGVHEHYAALERAQRRPRRRDGQNADKKMPPQGRPGS